MCCYQNHKVNLSTKGVWGLAVRTSHIDLHYCSATKCTMQSQLRLRGLFTKMTWGRQLDVSIVFSHLNSSPALASLFINETLQRGSRSRAQCCPPTATLQTLAHLATLPKSVSSSSSILSQFSNLTLRMAALRILKTTPSSRKSIRSAAFSSDNSWLTNEFQASQNCMCDTEHMFACPQAKQQVPVNV